DISDAQDRLKGLSLPGQIIVASFGVSPHKAAKAFAPAAENFVNSPNTTLFSQIASAEAIFGGIPCGDHPAIRLAYGYAEQEGMSCDTLSRIDAILREVVDSGAAPGVHVLVGRHGRIV